MIMLKLYPAEFRELFGYLRLNTTGQQDVPLRYQLVGKLVLLNYLNRWTPIRLYTWKERRRDKQFTLRLPVIVALALYQDMVGAMLTGQQQLLLAKLDQAIVNYRNPMADIHVIGELIQPV